MGARLSVTGTISPIGSAITSICVSKNKLLLLLLLFDRQQVSPFDDTNPKVSFGTTNGTIIIADMQTRHIEREFVVGHSKNFTF